MELNIVSREIIKPSSQTLHLKPYNLCLFDQLIPDTFVSVILFYPVHDPTVIDHSEAITQLKKSLSKALILYYPLSGRTKHNLYVDDFCSGVIFLEARVKCKMYEFFQRKNESQNQLVPFQPFCREKTGDVPPIAFQVNVFSCGGIALGISLCHKNADAATLSHFLKTWAAFSTGSPEKIIKPDLSSPAILFPPQTNDFLNKSTSLMDRLWFSEGDYVTKKYVFRAKSIETLKERAKSKRVPTPSRNEAISCLIWKHAMAASWAASGSPKPSVAGQAVNMRPRMKSVHGDNSLDNALGNFFWWALAAFDPDDYNVESSSDVELSELVVQMKGATSDFFNGDFISEVMTGNKEGLTEIMNQLEYMCSIELAEPDFIMFTSWKGYYNEVDFGFGKPFSVGTIGKVGPAFRNLVILVDADDQWGKGSVETFITLQRKEMALLESDDTFRFYL
ncbi:stemmadenine O-acetyltransferase-like [Humulus lupulus]|uniref:stemmadenine O-acetyltransferase-like n=1 Tax=Humulus lupulus TaxID=3486 RepID=UPI002B410146|nr:stemmadenine O-acetyltransferase-like [Humulus lupulus]